MSQSLRARLARVVTPRATSTAVIVLAAVLAVLLRRAGHDEGDDFALYLRQARSLFDGDMAAVVADNRFAVLNSDAGFSPVAYPWGWPLLLSPFVHLWGFTYDRLKFVEIAAFCVWLVMLHGIVRRRLGRMVAAAVLAAIATAPAYLEQTDQLLSEFPYLAAVGVVIWWNDRLRTRSTLITATSRELVVLGLLAAAAFNIRREGVVLVVVIVALQAVDVWRSAESSKGRSASLRRSWRSLVTPSGTFAVGVIIAQLVLPTDLLPGNGNDRGSIDDRWRDAPRIVAEQLGLGDRPFLGVVLVLVAVAGAVIGLRIRPMLDAPLLLLALLTAVVIGTHPRTIDRYWLQVTPWILVFASGAVASGARVAVNWIGRGISSERRSTIAALLTIAPLTALTLVHAAVLPSKTADALDARANSVVQDGPAHPMAVEMFDAVDRLTPGDAVVVYYRARTLTLLTDRRSFQTHDLERIRIGADYWVQRRNWGFWQPRLDPSAIEEVGFVEEWSNDRYVIWRNTSRVARMD